MLVGEEQHPVSALERPLEDRLGVGGGADDPAVPSDEALDRCGGVHVGHGDHRHTPVGVHGLEVTEHLFELLPALLDLVDVGHVGHRAAGGEVGKDHRLVGL